ncbi:MAG: ATP synthase F1 subunit gamma [Acidobacteriota bacterium]|nr:MAG: ATP synthase F1 subunit gamma [Acidobacteriota bacterium]
MAQAVRALTKRIESIDKTRKITRAMKLVAASKLRRAEERITRARVYGERIRAMAENLAAYAPAEHPLFAVRDSVRRVKLVLVTSDRGLCGSFNHNAVRAAQDFLKERASEGQGARLDLVGKKGWEFLKKRFKGIDEHLEDAVGRNIPRIARELARRLMREYTDGEVDEVHLLFNRFVSMAVQRVARERLLPASPPALRALPTQPPIFEPSAEVLFSEIVPRAVTVQVQNALADSEAAEHAARMAAMENATRNATDIIHNLTLVRNKMRQAAITSEIVEIVGAAEALRTTGG